MRRLAAPFRGRFARHPAALIMSNAKKIFLLVKGYFSKKFQNCENFSQFKGAAKARRKRPAKVAGKRRR
jgi:hypothetical protein